MGNHRPSLMDRIQYRSLVEEEEALIRGEFDRDDVSRITWGITVTVH
jgi:hypothetical protein